MDSYRDSFTVTLSVDILDSLLGNLIIIAKSFFIFIKAINFIYSLFNAHLCGLVARVPGYRSRGSNFDSHRY
jgi:hypothetical protein